MKPSRIDLVDVEKKRLLILSDGKPGHLNQSLAFARSLGYDFNVCAVSFRSRVAKAFSYLIDRCGLRMNSLFHVDSIEGEFDAVVSAGSETYFANKILAQKIGAKSVAIMLPRGYRYNFDLIVAQEHDSPPVSPNIISLPINLSYVEPQGLVTAIPGDRYVSLIVGGNSKHVTLDKDRLRQQVATIFTLFPEHKILVTSSRRTPPELEKVLGEFPFTRAILYSLEPINPIPDFLQLSEYVFLTADSSSMISEAVSYGCSNIEILAPHPLKGQNKFSRFLQHLVDEGCVHLFDGETAECHQKIDLGKRLREVAL